MGAILDPDTLERLRRMSPRAAFEQAKDAVYRTGAASSDDFIEVFEQLVEEGILSREELEELTR